MKEKYTPQFDYEDLPEVNYEEECRKITFKEKIFNALGTFGIIIYYGWGILVSVLPFVMIDVHFLLTLLFIAIEFFLPVTSIVFWIWGIIAAINGVQDIWAVIYYITTVILFFPFIIGVIIDFAKIFKK